jgi:transposase
MLRACCLRRIPDRRNGTLLAYRKTDILLSNRYFPRHRPDHPPQNPRNPRPFREIHVIAENLSAHKTARVKEFLETHPQMRLHFTPTYSSWLNQVELWFSKIERDVIARGVFTSVKDLARKLMRYIRAYNKEAKPFKWTYKSTRNCLKP